MRTSLYLLLNVSLLGLVNISTVFSQTTLTFQPNGANPVATQTYRWSPDPAGEPPEVPNYWYNETTPGTWVQGSIAYFPTVGNYTVSLSENVAVAGITTKTAQGGNFTTFQSSGVNPITLSFLENAEIETLRGSSHGLIFGSGLKLTGNVTLRGRTSGQNTNVYFTTAETYTDKVTIEHGIDAYINHTTSFSNAKISLAAATANLRWNVANPTIGELSGTAGKVIAGTSVNGTTLTIDQSTNTTFGGEFAFQSSRTFGIEKKGVGTLVLNGNQTHSTNGLIAVQGGSLYSDGTFASPEGQAQSLEISANARFGGTVTLAKPALRLLSADSIVAPGMYDIVNLRQAIGTMTLGAGLHAVEGGTFQFAVGLNESNQLVNSQFLLTGGALTLGADKVFTIRLIDLGISELAAGTHSITLFEIDESLAIPTNLEAFVQQWQLDATPSGWITDPDGPFVIAGNEVRLQFEAIPEPTTLALLPAGIAMMLWLRRRTSGRTSSPGLCPKA